MPRTLFPPAGTGVENQVSKAESLWWSQRCRVCRSRSRCRHSRGPSPACLDPTQPAALSPALRWLLSCMAPVSGYRVRAGARNELGKTSVQPARLEGWTCGLRAKEGHGGTCRSGRCRHGSLASVSPAPFKPTFPRLGREKKQKARGTRCRVLNAVQAAPAGKGDISRSSPEGLYCAKSEIWNGGDTRVVLIHLLTKQY